MRRDTMNGYDLLNCLEDKERQVRECVKNNSDTYAIFSCPKEYEKLVLEELERHNIGKSPVPTTNNIKTAEYVILRQRKEEVDEIVDRIIFEQQAYRPRKRQYSMVEDSDVSTSLAYLSLYFGIISMVFISCCGGFSVILAVIGFICGCMQPKRYGKKPGEAKVGIVLSLISIIGQIGFIVAAFLYSKYS